VTQEVFRWLEGKQNDLKDLWAAGAYTASFEVEMLVKNAAATGAHSAYQEVLNITVEDLES
jgi:hypothetical protein